MARLIIQSPLIVHKFNRIITYEQKNIYDRYKLFDILQPIQCVTSLLEMDFLTKKKIPIINAVPTNADIQ
jgi:hypothetical protein